MPDKHAQRADLASQGLRQNIENRLAGAKGMAFIKFVQANGGGRYGQNRVFRSVFHAARVIFFYNKINPYVKGRYE